MPALQLEGQNIQIRPLAANDLEPLYELETDEDVKRYVGGPVRMPRDRWITAMSRTLGPLQPVLAVVDNATRHFAGRASLSQNASSPTEWEVQVLIAKRYWHLKWGREVTRLLIKTAFEQLNASAIVAQFDPEHRASKELVESFSFQHFATMRTCKWNNGHLEYKLHREHYHRSFDRHCQ